MNPLIRSLAMIIDAGISHASVSRKPGYPTLEVGYFPIALQAQCNLQSSLIALQSLAPPQRRQRLVLRGLDLVCRAADGVLDAFLQLLQKIVPKKFHPAG